MLVGSKSIKVTLSQQTVTHLSVVNNADIQCVVVARNGQKLAVYIMSWLTSLFPWQAITQEYTSVDDVAAEIPVWKLAVISF